MTVNNQMEEMDTALEVKQRVVCVDGTENQQESAIVREHFMELFVNERLVAKLVCTPSDIVELVLGRLLTEGYIRGTEDVDSIYICQYGSKAKVFLKNEPKLVSRVETEASCCTGNQTLLTNMDISFLRPLQAVDYKQEWIFALANAFAGGSAIHRRTKGTHSCFLSVKGELVYAAEDIGRHNALDKAVGHALLQEYERQDCILFTTGRVPTDMVKKAVAAGVPVLVSKAVPTDAAIKMAREYKLTLICKAWPDRYEVFA